MHRPPDTEQIVISIFHFLIIQKLKNVVHRTKSTFNTPLFNHSIIQKFKNVIPTKQFLYGTAYQIRLKIALPSLHQKNKLKTILVSIFYLRNMFPNIKTCENRCSNFSENLRIVALKLLELTRFLSPNLSIYSYLL